MNTVQRERRARVTSKLAAEVLIGRNITLFTNKQL